MNPKECSVCAAPLSDREVRACESVAGIPANLYVCEIHRRHSSACEAVRHAPGGSR